MSIQEDLILPQQIFNTQKTDYAAGQLFLGQPMGLFDSINTPYPIFDELDSRMRVLDWHWNEFLPDFKKLNIEFKNCRPHIYRRMFYSLAFQWETDTIAANKLIALLAPFVTNCNLWALYGRIQDNEVVHARTYSEIVKNGFDNPEEVIREIHRIKETFLRLRTVARVFEETRIVGLKLGMGLMDREDPVAYRTILKFVCTLFALERIQFTSTFGQTFAIADGGDFIPIGHAVQKIAQDELEVHARTGMEIILIERKTERGARALNDIKPELEVIYREIIQAEWQFLDFLWSDGQEQTGVTLGMFQQYVLWSAIPVYKTIGLPMPFVAPTKNPAPYMDRWLLNDHQISPQEEKGGAYMLGGVEDDIGNSIIEVDF